MSRYTVPLSGSGHFKPLPTSKPRTCCFLFPMPPLLSITAACSFLSEHKLESVVTLIYSFVHLFIACVPYWNVWSTGQGLRYVIHSCSPSTGWTQGKHPVHALAEGMQVSTLSYHHVTSKYQRSHLGQIFCLLFKLFQGPVHRKHFG